MVGADRQRTECAWGRAAGVIKRMPHSPRSLREVGRFIYVSRVVGHHHCVNDVNHAIRLKYVRDGHSRGAALFVLQHDVSILHGGPQLAAFHGGQFGVAVACLDFLLEFCRSPLASDYVISENLGQGGFVFRLE